MCGSFLGRLRYDERSASPWAVKDFLVGHKVCPPYGEGGCYAVASLRNWSQTQMSDSANNEQASPIGEGDSVTRNVMPMACLERLAKRFVREAGINRKISKQRGRDSDYYYGIAEGYDRAATTLRAVAREIYSQHETRSRSSEPSA